MVKIAKGFPTKGNLGLASPLMSLPNRKFRPNYIYIYVYAKLLAGASKDVPYPVGVDETGQAVCGGFQLFILTSECLSLSNIDGTGI